MRIRLTSLSTLLFPMLLLVRGCLIPRSASSRRRCTEAKDKGCIVIGMKNDWKRNRKIPLWEPRIPLKAFSWSPSRITHPQLR